MLVFLPLPSLYCFFLTSRVLYYDLSLSAKLLIVTIFLSVNPINKRFEFLVCNLSIFLTIFHQLYAKPIELIRPDILKREHLNSESL